MYVGAGVIRTPMDIGLSARTHTPGSTPTPTIPDSAEDATVEKPMSGWSLDRTPMRRRGRPEEVAAAVRLALHRVQMQHTAYEQFKTG